MEIGKNIKAEKIALWITKWTGSVTSVITHTALFALAFVAYIFGADLTNVLLILTTIVSLEAIYLSIFIQMTINIQHRNLETVQKDVVEVKEDVGEIYDNVEDIQKDVEDIQVDVGELVEDDSDDDAIHRMEKTIQTLLQEIQKLKKK